MISLNLKAKSKAKLDSHITRFNTNNVRRGQQSEDLDYINSLGLQATPRQIEQPINHNYYITERLCFAVLFGVSCYYFFKAIIHLGVILWSVSNG